MTGTSVIRSFRAASRRAWPAMITPSAPTRIGFVHPNSAMLAATWATCSSECVRALRIYGMRRSTFHRSTMRSRKTGSGMVDLALLSCAMFMWIGCLRRLGEVAAEGRCHGLLVSRRSLPGGECGFDGLDQRHHLLRQLDAGGSHTEDRLNDLQEVHRLVLSGLHGKAPGGGHGSEVSAAAVPRVLPYGESYALLGCVWEGVEAPPDAVTTTGTSAAMVCEMAAARALAITGVSDVNRFATLAVTASALIASPAPAAATAPLVVSLAAVPAGDTVC